MQNKTLLNKIEQLKKQYNLKQLSLIILKRKDQKIYNAIISKTNFLPIQSQLKERLYCIEYNLKEIPLCPVCKKKHVHWYFNRYTIACSTKCSHNMEQYRCNYENAMLNTYGNKYPAQNEIFKKQIKSTLKENMEVKHITIEINLNRQ